MVGGTIFNLLALLMEPLTPVVLTNVQAVATSTMCPLKPLLDIVPYVQAASTNPMLSWVLTLPAPLAMEVTF
jgi:hypothetical protein